MTSNVNDKVFQKNLSKVVGPFFLTPGALNHPVISVDLQNNKCSKKDIGIPMMIDVVKFTNDKKKFLRKNPRFINAISAIGFTFGNTTLPVI